MRDALVTSFTDFTTREEQIKGGEVYFGSLFHGIEFILAFGGEDMLKFVTL